MQKQVGLASTKNQPNKMGLTYDNTFSDYHPYIDLSRCNNMFGCFLGGFPSLHVLSFFFLKLVSVVFVLFQEEKSMDGWVDGIIWRGSLR